MNSYRFDVDRIDYSSSRPFAELIRAFEQKCPSGEVASLNRLAVAQASRSQIEKTVEAMAGDLGFMHLVKIDQGALVSLLGKSKKMTVYYLGNPVIANQMFEVHPEAGLYAPLRALVYEDYAGVAHFTYDRPSSLLQQFRNEQIMAVARILDDRMEKLAKFVVG